MDIVQMSEGPEVVPVNVHPVNRRGKVRVLVINQKKMLAIRRYIESEYFRRGRCQPVRVRSITLHDPHRTHEASQRAVEDYVLAVGRVRGSKRAPKPEVASGESAPRAKAIGPHNGDQRLVRWNEGLDEHDVCTVRGPARKAVERSVVRQLLQICAVCVDDVDVDSGIAGSVAEGDLLSIR